MKKLVALCKLGDLPAGKPRLLRTIDGRRLACVRRGDRVDVVDDRCPHEGHPLSMGLVREGVLTCPWHNWKFDLGTGRCLFGGEAVRRYPVDVVLDEVFVDLALDADEAALRLEEDLVRAVAEGSVGGAVREALRLARVTADPSAPYVPLARMASTRTPYGAGDAIVALDAALELAARRILDDAEALAVAAAAVSDETRARAARPVPDATPCALDDRDAFLEDLLEERRTDAVAKVLGLPRETPFASVTEAWFVPFASLKLWDRGALLARVRSAEALATSLGDRAREALLGGVATSLGWAVAESDLPAFRATRVGLQEAARVTPGQAETAERDAYLAAVLRGEREAVDATLSAARAGVSPDVLLEILADAALVRLATYDLARSARVGSKVTAWDAARAVIFAHAATRTPSRHALFRAVMLAGVVGRLARVSVATRDDVDPPPSLRDAARAAALDPRATWSSRGRAVALAGACTSLVARSPGREALAARGLLRATRDDVGGGLARVAATARALVEGGAIDD